MEELDFYVAKLIKPAAQQVGEIFAHQRAFLPLRSIFVLRFVLSVNAPVFLTQFSFVFPLFRLFLKLAAIVVGVFFPLTMSSALNIAALVLWLFLLALA